MASAARDHFNELPPLTSDEVAEMHPGQTLSLVLLEVSPGVEGILFPVEYVHREVIYRTPGQKDAVALGTGRLVDCDKECREVRILFSRPNKTATMLGLTLEGHVKASRG